MLEQRIEELKAIIARNDGANAADARFARAVDELVSAFYDDIGRVRGAPSRAMFDLFVIKVLYVGRRSRHADVIDYLGELLETFVQARALYPHDAEGRPQRMYFSDLVDEQKRVEFFESRYEAYRRYADSALFVSGVFPESLTPRRPAGETPLRRERARGVDASYYVSTGKAMYRMAAREDGAREGKRRTTLGRLSECFEVYADALNEMSARYIMGYDAHLIADKMLDSINRYREGAGATALDDARGYAEILHVDQSRFPA
jgi:hypothetical protein